MKREQSKIAGLIRTEIEHVPLNSADAPRISRSASIRRALLAPIIVVATGASTFIRAALLVAGVAVILSFVYPSEVLAQHPSAALRAKGVNAALLLARAAQGRVRIIVDYKRAAGPAGATLGKANEDISGVIRENRSAQDLILSAHFGAPSGLNGYDRALRRMEISPSFAINATAAEIEALANDDRVTQIRIDGLNKPLLIQSVPLIGMTNAYSTYGATGVNWAVAVLDTGVAKTHEFIIGKVISEACYSTTNPGDGSTSVCPGGVSSSTASGSGVNCDITIDGCEHGTHVAGIAAGFNTSLSAGEPANGVAKSASIIAIQVFSKFTGANCGSSPSCVLAYASDMQAGLDHVYAIRASTGLSGGIASVNMSIGGGSYSSDCDSSFASFKTSIDNLRSAGIATVIAAGNSSSTSQISFPACISSAIAVAASDKSDAIAYYSNINSQVAVFAPGGGAGSGGTDILSSVPSGYACSTPAAGYCYLAGTSMATPHVAGAFAAMRSALGSSPTVTAILNSLVSTGKNITDNRFGGTITKPRIRVDQALAPTLQVTPATNIEASGPRGGPFSPSSFNYSISALVGSVDYSITGIPSWLNASFTSGTATTSPVTATFTLMNVGSLSPGVYNATISFTNTTDGSGTTSRTATLDITSPERTCVTIFPPLPPLPIVSPLQASPNSGVQALTTLDHCANPPAGLQ